MNYYIILYYFSGQLYGNHNYIYIIIYSYPFRMAVTYILPNTEKRLLGQFSTVSVKNERPVGIETDGKTEMA